MVSLFQAMITPRTCSSSLLVPFIIATAFAVANADAGNICKASGWIPSVDGSFSDGENWSAQKVPTAKDLVLLKDSKIQVSKSTSIGMLYMSGTNLIVSGADVRVSGDLDCSDGKCPHPNQVEIGALFNSKKQKICPSNKLATTTTTTLMGGQCKKVSNTKLELNSFTLDGGAEIQKGFGTEWIRLKRGCNQPTTGTAKKSVTTQPGFTYLLQFHASVSLHNADGEENIFSIGHVQVDGATELEYKVFESFNSNIQQWTTINLHFTATKAKTMLVFSEQPKNCILLQNLVMSKCAAISGGCSKTCQQQTCDYWSSEEAFTCVTLEREYGCNCNGCKCAMDNKACTQDKCLGKTCDEWNEKFGLTCATLKKNYGCKCTGCSACNVKLISTTTTTTTTTAVEDRTTTTTSTTSTTSTTVPGCTNKDACNYNKQAKSDDGSCKLPKKGHNCKDECVAKKDVCGICAGSGPGGDKSKCGAPSFVGDSYCDDSNNNCACGWDDGDCCGKKTDSQYKFCKKCKCQDATFKAPAPSTCKGACGRPKWKGDQNCDDENNVCGCDWDGGDCCGVNNYYKYCSKCKCLDPKFSAPAPSSDGCSGKKTCKKLCGKPNYKGDGFCDDENNHCGCSWDGGDCCGLKNYKYCNKCKCLDCKYKNDGDACVDTIKGQCKKPFWKGDGNCDDMNNNAGCNWDGGDCCGISNYKYCKKCQCLDCEHKAVADECTVNINNACGKIQYKGDKFCDDDNNNAACHWDGGDCCGGQNNYKHCKECKCLDCTYKPPSDKCTANVKGICQKLGWKGDGNCDDMNNNAGCNWDGGDCCGTENNYSYCKKCQCLDCTYVSAGDGCVKTIKKGCGKPKFKGDGFCDDENNRAGCTWDGGDCCGALRKTKYCIDCLCLDCKAKGDGCIKQPEGSCEKPAWKADKTCDDGNNNAGCGWDGGDCCGQNNDYKHCFVCACKDCLFKSCPGGQTCKRPVWKGDGNCDDENNVCGCNWDGGDCCGGNVVKKHCKDCQCLDPLLSKLKCDKKCGKPDYKKDSYCDDVNNHCGCDWDGGDCCGGAVQKKYCKECKCLDPKA